MRGGKLDTRVRIERAQQKRSHKGEVLTDGWALVTTVWAGERNTAAVERYAAQQLVAETDSAFEMRSWPGPVVFGPEERFRLNVGAKADGSGGTPYNVLGILKMPKRGQGVMVLCRARAETTTATLAQDAQADGE